MATPTELIPRRTSPYLSKFELARVIGMRMLQLHEEPVGIQTGETLEQVAIRELRAKQNPAVIRRHLPGGKFEDCAVRHLRFEEVSENFVLHPDRFVAPGGSVEPHK